MAKTGTKNDSSKVTFGCKKKGVSRKAYGPKDQSPKKYQGQGRKR